MHIETMGAHDARHDLVLIHGWAMHGDIFAPLLEQLGDDLRVHLVDLPGHGRSNGESRFELADCVARIAARVPRAIWVGWSLGGMVALRAAIEHAPQVRGVVLIASSPCFVAAPDWPHGVPLAVFSGFESSLQSDYRDTVERFLALETMGSPHAQTELRELKARVFAHGEPSLTALRDGLHALESHDLRAELAALKMPSLWISARRDRLVPSTAMQWAAQRTPASRYLEINSGHAPFISHPREIATALHGFAAELPA